ncbi:MAG: hypothetical protein Q9M76_07700 [Candidatus Dojkabacteria bacterium]|nr:hypothetical protein [Candidatus Dojkabacteria bacterium]
MKYLGEIKLTNKLSGLVILLISILSVITVGVNNGLYYSEFNDSVIVELSSEVDNKSEILDKIDSIDGISRIDRANYRIEIEYKNIDEVKSEVENELGDELNKVDFYKSVGSDQDKVFMDLFIILVIILISSVLVCYFVYFRNETRIKDRRILKLHILPIAFILSSIIIQAGIISALSGVYQIKQVDLYSIIFAAFLTIILYIWALNDLLQDLPEDKSEVLDVVRAKFVIKSKYTILSTIVILVAIAFGLGSQFVLTALIYTLALLVFTFVSLFNISIADRINSKIVRKPRSKKVTTDNKAKAEKVTSTKNKRPVKKTVRGQNRKKK